MRLSRIAAASASLVLALTACTSDDEPTVSPSENGSGGLRGPNAVNGEAALEAPPFDKVQVTPLSSGEHDRLLGAAFDSQNRLYGAGWVAKGADQAMAVARYTPGGKLDSTWGTGGVATVNVANGGKAAELGRGIVVQSNGKVVVSGTIEHDVAATGDAARDTDIALARFDTAGKLDPTFGTAGVVKLDLSTGVLDGTAYRGDTVWGLTGLSGDKLAVIGAQIGAGEGRKDLDFAVVRLNADGSRDASFGTNGVALVGVGPNVSETPKTAVEVAGGNLVVTGYASIDGIVKIVLFRLTPQGSLDPTFGTNGVTIAQLLGSVTESYAVAVAGNRLVTTGYGRDTADAKVDMIMGGFTLNGAPDPTFGTNGSVRIDVAGDDDRGRTIVGMADGSVVIAGSGKPSATNLEGMVVKLTPAGALDTTFAPNGRKLYDVGGPNDSFFGLAVSPDKSRVAAVGYLGRDTTGSEKDESAVLYLKF